MIVYGIKNCDTVKKALDWLKVRKINFEFHDYKSKGVSETKLKEWSKQIGWETLLNKKGTTWRQLEDVEKNAVKDESSAILLMIDKNSIIKRPLIEQNGKVVTLGFNESDFEKNLS